MTTRSHIFTGGVWSDQAGFSVASAGDVDGDGLDDLIIGAHYADGGADINNNRGETYLILAKDLAALDAEDGTTDGTIDLDQVGGVGGSYQFTGGALGDRSGSSVASAGDVDGDGRDDLIIGARNADGGGDYSGETYLILAKDLVDLDALDGTNGNINLGQVGSNGLSYQFTGGAPGDLSGTSVSSAGDVDGDGRDDLIIGANKADGGGSDSGETYLILAADLAAADAADGTTDGVIDLGLVAGIDGDNALVVTVNTTGSGNAVQTDVGTAELISVENLVANEIEGAIDTITITDTTVDDPFGDPTTDPTGARFNAADILDLDDNAVGTFTPDSGPGVNFGPTETLQLSDILALGQPGEIAITGGDESGTIGGISFENFEVITFGIVCFARGTLIKTRDGERPIEALAVGDAVMTMDAGYQPIRWIGARRLSRAELAANPRLTPIRIRAGALGRNLPERDLVVSPQHRILVRSPVALRLFDSAEVLIPANKLLTLPGIDIAWDADGVEYFHFLFDDHQIVWSNGAPTESLFTGPEALKSVPPRGPRGNRHPVPPDRRPGLHPLRRPPDPRKRQADENARPKTGQKQQTSRGTDIAILTRQLP